MYMRRLPCCRLKSCCCAPLQSLRSQRRKRRRKAVTWTISCSFSCAVCNRDQALEQSRQITSPVSLTNPHAGTWPSRKDPFLSRKAQIRPNSGLVAALYLESVVRWTHSQKLFQLTYRRYLRRCRQLVRPNSSPSQCSLRKVIECGLLERQFR